MDIYERSLELHENLIGKIKISTKSDIVCKDDLSLLYSPGVAAPCLEIEKNPESVYKYTSKGNMVAIVSDGTAVLGLGDIGPSASIPVMEGKAALFSRFAGIDAFPICVGSKDIDEIVRTIELISPVFGGINLEDIRAPKCFEIERKLKEKLDIPVFHDDQHGTAIVVLAALKNALKLIGKNIDEIKIVVNGLGAAGTAIIKLLFAFGAKNFVLCDIGGLVYSGALDGKQNIENFILTKKSECPQNVPLSVAVEGADLFIGVSAGGVLTGDMVRKMADSPLIFALANPTPEIMPEEAAAAGARIVCTGRTDYPNQINNVLAFPGIFRGALDAHANDINEEMKLAAVAAISELIEDDELSENNIIPSVFDPRVVPAVSSAVKTAAIKSGAARIN